MSKGTGKPIVLADSREKCSLPLSDAVEVRVRALRAGDYGDAFRRVRLERKRVDELATCCGQDRRRFLAQCERLQDFPIRSLIVEGDLGTITADGYRSRINPKSVLGTLAKLWVDWGIPPVLCSEAYSAAELVERLIIRVHRQETERAQLATEHPTGEEVAA